MLKKRLANSKQIGVDSDDGGNFILRKVGEILPDHTAAHRTREHPTDRSELHERGLVLEDVQYVPYDLRRLRVVSVAFKIMVLWNVTVFDLVGG
jgi:hypothetical protein